MIKGKHLFAVIAGLALIAIVGFVLWREAGHSVGRAKSDDARMIFIVTEFRDDPFPWNVLHGDNGLFHYRCEIHDQRGEVSAFSYFRGNSDGRAQEVKAQWESPNRVTAAFGNGIVVECNFSTSSKASWSLK